MPRRGRDGTQLHWAATPSGPPSRTSRGSRSGSRRRTGPRTRRSADGARRRRHRQATPVTSEAQPDRVRIYEVGPRDGLQNEAVPVPLEIKRRFLDLLADAGLAEIEATSFVAPKAIPQL